MDKELRNALIEQYTSYLHTIFNALENLQAFLNQNKDFWNMLDVNMIIYIKSLDIKLSMESHELRSSPDLQHLSGSKAALVAMCDELKAEIVTSLA